MTMPYDPKTGQDSTVGELEVVDSLILPYSLTTVVIQEEIDARSHVGYWKGTITYTNLSAAALAEDIKFIDAFPAKYKILEILVDNVEVWDDGAGPISAVTLSVGWTGAGYADLISAQDIYTAVTLIGDAAPEVNYTSIQGGIFPNWAGPTDLYLRFVAVGGNLDTLTSGSATIYISYQVYG